MAANMKVKGANNEPSSPLEDPEVINALAGSVRWVLDLMAWITDTLLALPTNIPQTVDLVDPNNLSLPELFTHLQETNNISLHLLLSSITRGFLTAICRRLTHLDYIARKAIAQTRPGNATNNMPNQNGQPNNQQGQQPVPNITPALRSAYMRIATLTNSTILQTNTFETLLSTLSSHIKTAYSSHSLAGNQQAERHRNVIEIKMMLGGAIPDAFKGVIAELFKPEGLLDSVREEIDPSRLFFADFSLLEVDEDRASMAARKRSEMTMDCFRKSWLPNPKKSDAIVLPQDQNVVGGGGARQGARWRRCARCAAVMEDVMNPRPALQWLVMQQRRCFCSGYWNALNAGEKMA